MNEQELKDGIIKAHTVLRQSQIGDNSGIRALDILTELVTKIQEEEQLKEEK